MEPARDVLLAGIRFPEGVYFKTPSQGIALSKPGQGRTYETVVKILQIVLILEKFEHHWNVNQNVKEIDRAYLARDREEVRGGARICAVGVAAILGGIFFTLATGGSGALVIAAGAGLATGSGLNASIRNDEINEIERLMNRGQRYSVAKLTILQQRK